MLGVIQLELHGYEVLLVIVYGNGGDRRSIRHLPFLAIFCVATPALPKAIQGQLGKVFLTSIWNILRGQNDLKMPQALVLSANAVIDRRELHVFVEARSE